MIVYGASSQGVQECIQYQFSITEQKRQRQQYGILTILQFIGMTDVTGPYVFINKATMRLVKSYTAVFIETQCTHIQPPIEKGVETTLCVTTGFFLMRTSVYTYKGVFL